MKRLLIRSGLLWLGTLLILGVAHCQPLPVVQTSNGAPTSGCGANWLDIDITTGNIYSCLASAWHFAAGGGVAGVSSVSGDAHFSITNPTSTPSITFVPQPNDYSFTDISGTINVSQLPAGGSVWLSGSGDPGLACTAPGNLYLDTGGVNDAWYCSSTNVWRKFLTTTNTGVWSITGTAGADPCGTVGAGEDCLSLNSNDQLTLKSPNGVVQIIGPNAPVAPTPGSYANQPLAGCGVEYTSGLNFVVGACQYQINGVIYNSAITTVTLATADPTNPRIDVIIVDNTATVSVLTGTPAATPAAPAIDPSTQLAITFATVAANGTTPSNITTDNIYDENTEWACTPTAHVNCASTSNPFRNTHDIEFTAAVLTNNASLVKPAAGTVDLATRNALVFYIRSKAAWPTGASGATAARSLAVLWANGATQKGLTVLVRDGTFGFNSSNTTSYQQISIPTSLFGANGLPVTTVQFRVVGVSGSSSIGLYIDAVSLQGGASPPALPTTLMNFKGTWSSATAYNANDTVVSGGIGYVALLPSTNVAVTTAATWAPVAGCGSTCVVASSPGAGVARFAGSTQTVTSSELSGAVTTSGSNVTTLATKYTYRSCTVIIGDPGAGSPALANDNDSPVACANDVGSDWTITSVACWADAGSPTVTPILTGGTSTSVLTGALTCGTASWAAGTVQGTAPVVHSFSANGATCSSTPCTIDANITTAGGTAKYLIIKIVGTI